MVLSLNKLGIIKNKTYESNKLPIVNNDLLYHMIRGIFDGDGSIWSIKKNEKTIKI